MKITDSRLAEIVAESRASEGMLSSAPETVQLRNKELASMAEELLKRRRFCAGLDEE